MTTPDVAGFGRTSLAFALVGPPIGGFALLAPVFIAATMAGQISSILVGLVAVPLYSYVFGIVPAWLTGVAAAAISPLVKRNSVWVGITAAIGWIFVSIALAAMQLLMDDPGQQLLNGYVGAVPALLCALMTQSRRPRQGNPIPARS